MQGENHQEFLNQPITSTQSEKKHSLPESDTQFDENGDVIVTWHLPRVSEKIDESEFHSLVQSQQDLPSPSTNYSNYEEEELSSLSQQYFQSSEDEQIHQKSPPPSLPSDEEEQIHQKPRLFLSSSTI